MLTVSTSIDGPFRSRKPSFFICPQCMTGISFFMYTTPWCEMCDLSHMKVMPMIQGDEKAKLEYYKTGEL